MKERKRGKGRSIVRGAAEPLGASAYRVIGFHLSSRRGLICFPVVIFYC